MSIASNIKDMREIKRLTQAELARLSGCTPAALCLIEGDKRDPELRTLIAIAKAMEIPLSYLLDDRPATPTLCPTCNGRGVKMVRQGGVSLRDSHGHCADSVTLPTNESQT